MDHEKLAQLMFATSPSIRYVAIVDSQDHVLISKMREGLTPFADDATYRELVSTYPPLVLRALQRMPAFAGDFTALAIRYEKLVLVGCRKEDNIVLVACEPETQMPFLDKIVDAVRNSK